MKRDEVKSYWLKTFPDSPPVSYLFKDAYAERWIRFHSLAGSKRYPDDALDLKVLLSRHNEVLSKLVKDGEKVLLIFCTYAFGDDLEACDAIRNLKLERFHRIAKSSFDHDDGDNEIELECYFAFETFEKGKFDAVFACVANDVIDNFFVVSQIRNEIFAPYDGGIDVICEDAYARDKLREAFPQWLSPHPAGL